MLGLPDDVRACLFDLDGVLTDTARVHRAAWAQAFDEFLPPGAPRFSQEDYNSTVDGRPRLDGVRTFLASRGISVPEGTPQDPPTLATVHGLAARKNDILLRRIRGGEVAAYPGSVRYLEAAVAAGVRRAVVSASANCREVLAAVGIENLIEERIDGIVAVREQLRGKPYPDTFLAAARALGVAPLACAAFEDAIAGVAAAAAAGCRVVVGVDRVGQAPALRGAGAHIVVTDLAELLP